MIICFQSVPWPRASNAQERRAVVIAKPEINRRRVSILLPLLPGRARHLGGLEHADGAIAGYECLVRNPADIAFCHFVDAVDFLEEIPPVSEQCLPQGELVGEPRVAAERPPPV